MHKFISVGDHWDHTHSPHKRKRETPSPPPFEAMGPNTHLQEPITQQQVAQTLLSQHGAHHFGTPPHSPGENPDRYRTPPSASPPKMAPPTRSRTTQYQPENAENHPFSTSPRLFLGSIGSSNNRFALQFNQISVVYHFHNHAFKLSEIGGIDRFKRPFPDNPEEVILDQFKPFYSEVKTTLSTTDSCILLSCKHGISRSGSMLTALLILAAFDSAPDPGMVHTKLQDYILTHRDNPAHSSFQMVLDVLVIIRDTQNQRVPTPKSQELLAPNPGFVLQLALLLEELRTEKEAGAEVFERMKQECIALIQPYTNPHHKPINEFQRMFDGITGYDESGIRTLKKLTFESFSNTGR